MERRNVVMETSPSIKRSPSLKKKDPVIFIVEDNATYLLALRNFISKLVKCAVYCYTTGEACLKNLSLSPDIIILDYYLTEDEKNGINGKEVLKKVKKRIPGTGVIMLSGQDHLDIAVNSIKEGAFTYIIKDSQTIFALEKAIRFLIDEKKRK